MVSKIVKYKNPMGLQVKQAGDLCKVAMEYKCSVSFAYDGGIANAKSMLSVLGSGVRAGDELNIVCDGPDEEDALERLTEFLEKNEGIL